MRNPMTAPTTSPIPMAATYGSNVESSVSLKQLPTDCPPVCLHPAAGGGAGRCSAHSRPVATPTAAKTRTKNSRTAPCTARRLAYDIAIAQEIGSAK